MRVALTGVAAAVAFLSAAAGAQAAPSGALSGGSVFASSAKPVPVGDVVVRYRRGTDATERRTTRGDADTRFERRLRLTRSELVEPRRGQTARAAVRELERDPDVLYAELNLRVHANAPADPLFGDLWGLNNSGQVVGGQAGLTGADIDALNAWQVSTGSRAVLVAIVDTGIDRSHPDLAANVWTNPGEDGEKRSNGVDDDGDGQVDDWRGWDFSEGDNDPHDGNEHGTHVAGTIGAAGDNGIGVAGVNHSVSLVGVKVLGDGGAGTTANVADGFVYAGRLHADVVNASLGGEGTSQAISDAIASSPHTLFVVAAGNDNVDVDDSPVSPCAEPNDNLICVAATDNRDDLAGFSNFGSSAVDLGAPGVDILSTVPGGDYARLSGTSMATPHVAGAAALIEAVYPTDDPTETKARMFAGVEPDPALQAITTTGGRLDLRGALGQPSNPPPAAQLSLDPPSTARAQQSVRLDASASTDDSAVATYEWDLDGNGTYETSTRGSPVAHTAFDSPGSLTVGVRVRDDRGASAVARRELEVVAAPDAAPVARLGSSPTPAIVRQDFDLDASGSTGARGLVRYEWDLDGDWSYETDGGGDPHHTHRFDTPGRRRVGVRVTDSSGDRSETRLEVQVALAPPVADFDFAPAAPVVDETVTFDGSAAHDSDGYIDWYSWDLDGDGFYETLGKKVVTHRYSAPGPVTVRYQVVDDDGQIDTLTRTIDVGEGAPVHGDGAPQVSERAGESDGDGVIEPGEGLVVEQSLRNGGAQPAADVRGEIHSARLGDLVPGGDPGQWPDIPPGGSAAPATPLAANTYGSAACGRPLEADVTITTDQGKASVPVTIPAGGVAGTHEVTNRTSFMPDDLEPGAWSWTSENVNVRGGIKDVDIRIGELRHSNVGDLVLAVEPPGDDTWIFDGMVTLIDRRGGSGDDLVDTVFDSDAPTSIADASPPFTGRFRPEQSLDQLDGQEAYGQWGFYVENWSENVTGHLNAMSFEVSPALCDDGRNEEPHASLVGSPWDPGRGQELTLDASGTTDADGRIVEYRWDLDGDGYFEQRGTEPTRKLTYHDVGWHYVGVQVVDDKRGVSSATTSFQVKPSIAPEAVIDAPQAVEAGKPAHFDASRSHDPDGTIVAYSWDFDQDGVVDASGPAVDHTFATSGWHGAHLGVVDDSGVQAGAFTGFWVSEPTATPPVSNPPSGTPPGNGTAPPGTQPAAPFTPPAAWTPAPMPSAGDVTAPPPQGQAAPALRFDAPGRISLAALAKGLPITAACDPDCTLLAELKLPRSVARRLRLARRAARGDLVIARRTRTLAAQRDVELRLRVPARIRRALARLRHVPAKVDLTAAGPGGYAHATRRLSIRRGRASRPR